jgi:hypothetical protein
MSDTEAKRIQRDCDNCNHDGATFDGCGTCDGGAWWEPIGITAPPEPHPTPRAHEPEVRAPAPAPVPSGATTERGANHRDQGGNTMTYPYDPKPAHDPTRGWPQCVKCGTSRHPDSLDASGACRDAVWCRAKLECDTELAAPGRGRQ